MNWKNFDFSFLLQGSGKCDFFISGDGIFPFNSGSTGNVLQVAADGDRWIPEEISGTKATENPNAKWPRLTYGRNENNAQKSTFWLQDGRYLRLKNVELTYTLPATLTRKFYVNRMQVGFIGENLYTWSPFKLWDPETESGEGVRSGAAYPINRTFTGYLRFEF